MQELLNLVVLPMHCDAIEKPNSIVLTIYDHLIKPAYHLRNKQDNPSILVLSSRFYHPPVEPKGGDVFIMSS